LDDVQRCVFPLIPLGVPLGAFLTGKDTAQKFDAAKTILVADQPNDGILVDSADSQFAHGCSPYWATKLPAY
jgi:hypothetical protein